MKAMRIHQLGELSNLALEEVDPPLLKAGHVIIRNLACGVNPIDWKTCTGGGAAPHIDHLPFTPGWESAGEVIAVADDVQDFKVGDRVMGLLSFPKPAGCLAQEVLASAQDICHLPDNLEPTIGGALGIAGLTAWQALFDKGALLPGQTLLVLGGAGGVGHLAVQIGVVHGAKVWATASPKNHDKLTNMGATCIDYHTQKLSDVLSPVDLIVDCVGGESPLMFSDGVHPDGVQIVNRGS